ncbi:unnamed protein product [Schistocephalus solidus]|uniref:C2H2-type domain-containing protein n=1 Tax=Schistocephalus solidus TaxID=70667 RepID=A0A183TMC4_SCHSO|nr:unnamed protein product [Schistocephalus solidus]
MGLFGHTRIHDNGKHRHVGNTNTPHTPSTPAIYTASTNSTNDNCPTSLDFSCPNCFCNFTSRIGLVGHLRINNTETCKPVRDAPTYSRHAHFPCPHYFFTFTKRMAQLGHIRLHDNLR